MVSRSVLAVCVTAMLATLGCSASTEDAEESAPPSGETAAPLALMPLDERPLPAPLDLPAPALPDMLERREQLFGPKLARPVWDLRRFLEDVERPVFQKPCYQYEVEIWDPARGRNIRVPITVCD